MLSESKKKHTKENVIIVNEWKKTYTKENVIVIGRAGSSKCYHPWDDLKPCTCGSKERPLLMHDKNTLYSCGDDTTSVFVICPDCERHTSRGQISNVIENWNDQFFHEDSI